VGKGVELGIEVAEGLGVIEGFVISVSVGECVAVGILSVVVLLASPEQAARVLPISKQSVSFKVRSFTTRKVTKKPPITHPMSVQ